jgi:hypothetical protein
MKHKIIALAATIAAGALSMAPASAIPDTVSAQGTVHVTADVLPAIAVTATTDAVQTNWNSSGNVPFTVTVNTNDPYGYVYQFTGANPSGGGPNSFALIGTGANANSPTYSITGPQNEPYQNGIFGSTVYTTSGSPAQFNVNLPAPTGLPADAYTDTLTVTVTTAVPT